MGLMSKDHTQTKRQAAPGLLAKPLDSLVFLLPLIAFYEVCSVLMDTSVLAAGYERVVAFQLLQIFFELFGVTGILMPGLAVIAILVATHVVSRRAWRFDKRAVAFMYVESALWALPLLFLVRFTQMSATHWPMESFLGNAALCVGAGIYEELIFRLVLISLIAVVGADLLRFSHSSTLVAAVLISAGLFALHHHPPLGSEPFDAFRCTFRALAGVYLGTIFVFRGYGPAAGAHIGYNLLVITLAGWN